MATIFRCATPGNLVGLTSEAGGADERCAVESGTSRTPSFCDASSMAVAVEFCMWSSRISDG